MKLTAAPVKIWFGFIICEMHMRKKNRRCWFGNAVYLREQVRLVEAMQQVHSNDSGNAVSFQGEWTEKICEHYGMIGTSFTRHPIMKTLIAKNIFIRFPYGDHVLIRK